MEGETRVQIAERHVRQAEMHVARQKEMIERLRRRNRSTVDDEKLLQIFMETLRVHQDDLEKLGSDSRSTEN